MSENRREFLERLGLGAMLVATPRYGDVLRVLEPRHAARAEDFDLTWTSKVNGKYRAVFDVPEIDGGTGVWRASLWQRDYMNMLAAKPEDCSAVVVMRHNGIALAMQQSFWDTYGIAKKNKVINPVTEQPTDRNPALMSSSRGEVPAELDDVALDKFIGRGGIALACNLAFDDMIDLVKKKDGSSPEAARKTALAGLVPGVILQPSGVFAAIHAQDVGCKYLRAS